jgi:integrase
VSVLVYSGLRPGEALALEWSDIGKKSINVDKGLSLVVVGDAKTHTDRVVLLLKPPADDLKALQGFGLVFPRRDGEPWSDADYCNWRGPVWQSVAAAVGIATLERKVTVAKVEGKRRRRVTSKCVGPRPYDLWHSMASLLLAEGMNPVEVAENMGHGGKVLYDTYAHVVKELRGSMPVSATKVISTARGPNRAKTRGREVESPAKRPLESFDGKEGSSVRVRWRAWPETKGLRAEIARICGLSFGTPTKPSRLHG